jgi:hypothetical protein
MMANACAWTVLTAWSAAPDQSLRTLQYRQSSRHGSVRDGHAPREHRENYAVVRQIWHGSGPLRVQNPSTFLSSSAQSRPIWRLLMPCILSTGQMTDEASSNPGGLTPLSDVAASGDGPEVPGDNCLAHGKAVSLHVLRARLSTGWERRPRAARTASRTWASPRN